MTEPGPVTALAARGVEKVFGAGPAAVRALRGVDLTVADGEFVAIMGPSGSGKSTLLHILGGLDKPTEGSVAIHGKRYDDLGDRELTRMRGEVFGFVFQFFNLLPTLTAAENVVLPALIAGERPSEHADRVDELLEYVGLGRRERHRPSQLSGGEQQRVAIARALANRPALLLADEPTGELDARTGAEMIALFERLNRDGTTVVVVTHDEELARAAKRVIHMRDGTIIDDVRADPADRRVEPVGLAPEPHER